MNKPKTNAQTGKSLATRVMEYAAAHPTFKSADVTAVCSDKPSGQVQTTLWALRKKGLLTKDEATGAYSVLTGVNAPPTEAKPEVKDKPKAVEKPTGNAALEKKLHIAERDAKYWQERSEMHMHTITALRQQHEDALAIIRYLENKLYIALQMVAKNGGNS